MLWSVQTHFLIKPWEVVTFLWWTGFSSEDSRYAVQIYPYTTIFIFSVNTSQSFPNNSSAILCCSPLKDVALKVSNFNKTQKTIAMLYLKAREHQPPNLLCTPSLAVSRGSYKPKAPNAIQVVFAGNLAMLMLSSTCKQFLSRREEHVRMTP